MNESRVPVCLLCSYLCKVLHSHVLKQGCGATHQGLGSLHWLAIKVTSYRQLEIAWSVVSGTCNPSFLLLSPQKQNQWPLEKLRIGVPQNCLHTNITPIKYPIPKVSTPTQNIDKLCWDINHFRLWVILHLQTAISDWIFATEAWYIALQALDFHTSISTHTAEVKILVNKPNGYGTAQSIHTSVFSRNAVHAQSLGEF